MAHLSVQLLDEKIIDADNLIKVKYREGLEKKNEDELSIFHNRKSTCLVHFPRPF